MPIIAVAALMVCVSLISYWGRKNAWNPEVMRKCVHVMVGLFAITLPYTFPNRLSVVILILGALLVMTMMRVSPKFMGNAGAAIHSVERESLGDIWLALTIGFLFLRSQDDYVLYSLPLAIITLSDAAAALTGSTYGKRRFVTEGGTKSIEGVVAFVMVGWISAMSILLLFSDASRVNVIILGLTIGVFGAVVEAVSWRGLDNLFVPLSIHFFLRKYLDADTINVLSIAFLFIGGTVFAQMFAGKMRIAKYTANAFAIALFMFLGIGAIFGGIIPGIAMAVYLWQRKYIAESGSHPALDFLATICGAGLIWVFIDETAGITAVHFYNLAMAGIAVAYAILGLCAQKKRHLAFFVVPVAWIFCVLLAYSPLAFSQVPQNYLIISGISILSISLVAFLKPHFLRRWRAPRIVIISSIIPMIAFVLYLKGFL